MALAKANQQAQVICPDGGIPNALGNCPGYKNPIYDPVDMPVDDSYLDEMSCVEKGLVQCATGECANTKEKCPDIYDDYNKSMNITAEGEFIDKPTTEENEALRDIYEGIGGFGWTGLSFEDWSAKYGDEFPEWAGSLEQEQYQLVQAQMGLLGAETENVEEAFKLGVEQMRYKSSAELESIGQAREDLIRKGGGLQSGQREEKIESAYDQVLKGFDFDVRSQELSYEQDLIGLEGRKLGYELDLSTTVSDFQDKMWDLIAQKQDMMGDAEGGEVEWYDCEGTRITAENQSEEVFMDECGICGGDGSTCVENSQMGDLETELDPESGGIGDVTGEAVMDANCVASYTILCSLWPGSTDACIKRNC